jgi:hypothetical protein
LFLITSRLLFYIPTPVIETGTIRTDEALMGLLGTVNTDRRLLIGQIRALLGQVGATNRHC